jgi:hypothetical protein
MKLTPCAKAFFNEFDRGIRLLCVWGGIGSGKSYAAAQLALYMALTRLSHDPDTGETEPLRTLITADSAPRLQKNMIKACREVFGPLATYNGSTKEPHFYFPSTGATVVCWAYKLYSTRGEGESSIEGENYNVIISDETQTLDEQFFVHAFDRSRLEMVDIRTGKIQQPFLLWMGRPNPNDSYLVDARRRRDEHGVDVEIIFPRTRDNPHNSSGYIKDQRANRTLSEFLAVTQETPGMMMPVEGGIYANFSPLHLKDGGNLVSLTDLTTTDIYSYPTYIGLDFNIDKPSILFIQEHEILGRLRSVIVDEWCPDKEVFINELIDYIKNCNYYDNIVMIYPDPAGGARNVGQSAGPSVVQMQRPVDKGGVGKKITAAYPDAPRCYVEPCIQKIQARICNADEDRDLLVLDTLWNKPKYKRGIKHTMLNYSRDKETRIPLTGSKGNHSDHIADALRYYMRQRCFYYPLTRST